MKNHWATFINRSAKLAKKGWMPLAILIITMAIFFSLFRALTPWAKQYKGELEQHLSTIIGQPVIISSMETSWYWFEPVLKLNQVTVSDDQQHALTMNKLLVGINLLSSIWHWHIQPGILYIDDAHLTLRQVDNHWQIDGLSQDKQVTTIDSESYLPILNWLLGQQKIIIKNASAMVHLNDGTLLPLGALNLTAINSSGHYQLRGHAKLNQTMSTELLVLADMNLNPYALSKANGHAYFSVHHFLPDQWRSFFPQAKYHLDGGKGGFEVWVDVAKGHFSGIQTRLHFNHIAWGQYGSTQQQFIQSLRANLAWKPTGDGWQLSGDKITLKANGTSWPMNSLLINHQRAQQTYRVFVNTLLLEPLLTTNIQWPEIMQPVLALHPRGQLHNTQIEVRKGEIDYVLTRFVDLSWQGKDSLPAVSHLSGVLNWQPTEGRIELDGEQTEITLKGYPTVTFAEVNGAFDWKELSHGLRISMERLVLSRQDLVLSARGALDEPLSPSTRNLRLNAEFSAENAEQWLPYVPSSGLKPKLNEWLKQDIKRIGKASGQLTVNGPTADFPFDNAPGEFSIVSRLSGVDLLFKKRWPLNRDVDAYLTVNKRAMNVDILQADLHGILVDKVNLRIDEIGLDKETMLIHGNVDAPAEKAMAYIFASPLRKHLARLKILELQGPINLDLRLEVPLYPENDDVLARGVITLDNNNLKFHDALDNVALSHLLGTLQFDEHGVTDSTLKATFLDDPVNIRIQSIRQSNPSTQIMIDGSTSLDVLREKLNFPATPFMQGHLNFESKFTLTERATEWDNIQVNTSLKGVSIDLPAPLGKTTEESTPLTIKVGFKANKALKFNLNYDNRVSSDLNFIADKDTFLLEKGEIRVGSGQAQMRKQPGVILAGSLPALDVAQWREAIAKWPVDASSPSLFNMINAVDMKLSSVAVWGKKYQDVAIKANRLGKDDWSMKLDQRDIAGDLRYQRPTNTFSGHFSRLYLANTFITKDKTNPPPSTLKPREIPNLNVTIDEFKLDDVVVGSVALKSKSTETQWHLEDCKINSPAFQLAMKGDWKQQGKSNNTVLEADMKVKDLAEGLQRWHVTPAVEAHQGDIQFRGGWPGAINDFSLSKVNGQLYLGLKDGRITHLSPETEEKLGLGKLLSILSLQTIPRRLKLDFSDLSSHGYSFDEFKGNFILKKGVMSTSDSYIDGPVAYASMKGDLDLGKQLYDLDLHVSPHITASLPVVATIAGGPIAGMAAWVASKIINQGMQKVTGYSYKVSGPWLDPIVQQVSIYKKQSNSPGTSS